MDWALRLQLQTQNLSDYFGSQQRATIIREVPEEEFTSYSLILPSDCDHPDCIEASNNCSLTPSASQVTKLVLKATDQRDWVVECSLFGKVRSAVEILSLSAGQVDIPVADGGLPGRRLSGPDRGRGVSAGSGGQAGADTTPTLVLGVKTPVVSGYNADNNRTKLQKEKMKEYCNKLRKEDLNSFHQECCLNNLVSDPRCTLGALFNAYQEQHQEVCTVSTLRGQVVRHCVAGGIPASHCQDHRGESVRTFTCREGRQQTGQGPGLGRGAG